MASFEVCDLTSVTCDVTFFAKSLLVTVHVDKNFACLFSLMTINLRSFVSFDTPIKCFAFLFTHCFTFIFQAHMKVALPASIK